MIGHDLAAALPELRAHAESRMTSRVTVWRETGRMVQDETTGLEQPERVEAGVDIPARLKGGRSRSVTIGGVEFEEATAEMHLPADLDSLLDEPLADNAVLELTDGEWAGTSWRVIEAVKGDQRTARRVPIVEAS